MKPLDITRVQNRLYFKAMFSEYNSNSSYFVKRELC